MDIYLKRMDGNLLFLTIGHSNFAYLERFPIDKDFVLFEEDALVSYANLVTKYNFKKRGIQKFGALTHSFALLPPLRQTVSLRYAGEKSISLGGKKVDAIQLVIKHPDYKEASIWINKWAHTILKVENSRIGFEAELVSTPAEITAKDYALENQNYREEQIEFKNKDLVLSGTLTLPEGDGPHPAVMLVGGPGPLDREGLGMFTNLRDALAKEGIAVLSFDKRGIGKSQGDFSRFTKIDTTGDLESALDFLSQQDKIDKTKIGVLGHSEGGYYAAYLGSQDHRISFCIIMAGMVVPNIYGTDLETIDYYNRLSPDWDKEYLADIARSTKQTMKVLQEGKDWMLLLGKRVYLKKARLDLENNPLDVAKKLKIPTLMLQGKKDTIVPIEHAKLLEGALKEGGNEDYDLVFFDALGHFFGDIIQDGTHRTHLATNPKVIETITQWIEKIKKPVEPEPAEEIAPILDKHAD